MAEAGYAVDTLETATDWSNVDGLLKIEASCATAGAEVNNVHPPLACLWRGVEHLYRLAERRTKTRLHKP